MNVASERVALEIWQAAEREVDSLYAENARLRAALEVCAAEWGSSPGTVMSAAQELSAEFRRRMEIAHAALSAGTCGAPTENKND